MWAAAKTDHIFIVLKITNHGLKGLLWPMVSFWHIPWCLPMWTPLVPSYYVLLSDLMRGSLQTPEWWPLPGWLMAWPLIGQYPAVLASDWPRPGVYYPHISHLTMSNNYPEGDKTQSSGGWDKAWCELCHCPPEPGAEAALANQRIGFWLPANEKADSSAVSSQAFHPPPGMVLR